MNFSRSKRESGESLNAVFCATKLNKKYNKKIQECYAKLTPRYPPPPHPPPHQLGLLIIIPLPIHL